MIVASDTSPLCYLVLIREEHLLERMFGQVFIPPAVEAELRDPKAPQPLREWVSRPPSWLQVREPEGRESSRVGSLGAGEAETIDLALDLGADLVLLDDLAARRAAQRLELNVTGLLGVLDAAARRGHVDLPAAVRRLQSTSFRASPRLLFKLLDRNL